jgi:DNA-binding NarL/FixJ family response regulator
LRAARTIRAELPGTGVLVLSQYAEEAYAVDLLGESAEGVGYLLKDRVADSRGFADSVRQVGQGGSALDPEVVAQMLSRPRDSSPLEGLSSRQRDVLAAMAEGHSNRTIADELGLRERAVERDIGAIFSKLDLPAGNEGHRRVLAVLTFLRM